MSPGDDDKYYYRRKPHRSIVRRQQLSAAARLASYVYEDHMHARDGTIPDERTAKGIAWHRTVLGVRDARAVTKAIVELIEAGDLVRLGDGRLTSAEVQREIAWRTRQKKPPGGTGEGGGGQGSGGPPQLPFQVIDGGRAEPAPPQAPVDKPADRRGMVRQFALSSVRDAFLKRDWPGKTQSNQRNRPPHREKENHHEVVAVGVGYRARGDPLIHPP